MLGPQGVNGSHLLGIAAAQANRDVVEYLVLHRGLWYPQALARAVYRGSTNKSTASVEISRFLYAHAQTRARELQTSLETEIEFGSVNIFKATTYGNYETARWLAECVLEVDTAATLAPLSPQDEAVFPHTPEAQALVRACLRARREQCRGLAWMPKWTVDACCYEAFAMLVDMDHPNLHEAVPMVTNKLRDSRFVCKLLAVKHGDQRAWPASRASDVIIWAAGAGAMSVLAAVETQLQHCERGVMDRAIAKAVRNGHVEVLQWLHARALLLPRETERNDATDAVAELVCLAAQHDRIDCQRWLVTTFHVPAPLVEEMLEKATEQHDFGIACMLMKRYAP